MSDTSALLHRMARGCAGIVGSFALWTLWLALAVTLVLQIYVASRNELTVPEVALQWVERRLAAVGLRAAFDRSSVDPAGRILLQQVRVHVAGISDPVVTARAVYVELNPWMLAAGIFAPREIRVSGGALIVPGRFSPSAAPEELVRDLEAVLRPGNRSLDLVELNARVANMTFTAHGILPLPPSRNHIDPQLIPRFIERHLASAGRKALTWTSQLQTLQQPALHLEWTPSESGSPAVDVTLSARGLDLPSPTLQAGDLRLSTRALILGELMVSRIGFEAAFVRTPSFGGAAAGRVRGILHGRMHPGLLRFEPRDIELTAATLTAAGFSADALSATVRPGSWPRLDARLTALVGGEPVSVAADVDFGDRRATLGTRGRIAPALLDTIGEKLKVDVRRYFDFAEFELLDGEVRLGPGWGFEGLTATAQLQGIEAYGVSMDQGGAVVAFDGRRFEAPEAWATLGQNFARGSYIQDLQTREFRFLLDGRLRPMDISPWFRPWWRNFFRQFEFPEMPPEASVDVGGFWREGWRTRVFVFAESPRAVIRGGAFDRVRTRLFIRPGFFDGLEVFGTQDSRSIRGTFTFINTPSSGSWRSLELSLVSNAGLELASQVIGPHAREWLAPFQLANPPEMRVNASFQGPDSPGGRHHRVALTARTTGRFQFHHFPMEDATFTAQINDDEILLNDFAARLAEGAVAGHARVWGRGAERRVGFDISLTDAGLGLLAGSLEQFFAIRQHREPAPPGRYVRDKASVRVDIAASAEGSYTNPMSFQGSGNALLRGEEIGEVPLLGALSELLRFTALRLTSAQANFRIDRTRLAFSEVALRGPSAAIDARGDYLLDRRELDFNARVFPFQESGNILKSVVGAVLAPLSTALEVKLTGTLQKPVWGFVMGPTNVLRALSSDGRQVEPDSTPGAPASTPPETSPASPPESSPAPPPPDR